MRPALLLVLLASPLVGPASAQAGAQSPRAASKAPWDVVVYGGTSGGVAAAVQAARLGRSVILLEPGTHLGGLSAGGLGATDIGNKSAIGGLSRDFYRRLRAHYAQPESWTRERAEEFSGRGHRPGEDAVWTFEPHVAEAIFGAMVAEVGVPVRFGARLDLDRGAVLDGTRIRALRLANGGTVTGQVFVDASYEGDLMAAAGVPFHVGREANSVYGETLNGVQTKRAVHHQFTETPDPYVVPGDPSSGLLPGIRHGRPEADGTGDGRVQAYCFRMCTTDVPENRLPWPKPRGYDPAQYELLLRNFEAGDLRAPWNPVRMPNRKTDTNNNFAISTDYLTGNVGYVMGSWADREMIVAAHAAWQQGLMWTLANDPRVPARVQRKFQDWALCKDEFVDNGGWPHQLYVREARRMIGVTVMTEHHCRGTKVAADPIGLAAYTMDSHHVQRYLDGEGRVRNEGDVQVGGFPPYGISLGAVLPPEDRCTNLVVPVCLSASHIAYGSIRMEPVFMVLGQSAAVIAHFAVRDQSTVQGVAYPELRDALLERGQILEHTRRAAASGVPLPKGRGQVAVDDDSAKLAGEWTHSTSTRPFFGRGYRHDGNVRKGSLSGTFTLRAPTAGNHRVFLSWPAGSNRATNVPVEVRVAGRLPISVILDQRQPLAAEGAWVSLGRFRSLDKGTRVDVVVSNTGTDGYVILDAARLEPVR